MEVMEVDTDTELKKDESLDKCRCCLQNGELKDLWSEYLLDDGVITYGQTLVECFSLALHQLADVVEKICVTCIGKLQDANAFKKLVLESDKKMLECYLQGEGVKMDGSEVSIIFHLDGGQSSDENNPEIVISDDDIKQTTPEYLDLELLEAAGSNEPMKTKDPKPKTKIKKRKIKKYSPESLLKCMRAINLELMNAAEAALYYNIPYQTINRKLRAARKKEEEEEEHTKKEDPKPKTKKKRKFREYSPESLLKCMKAVNLKLMSMPEAAEFYNIPYKTINDRLRETRKKEGPLTIEDDTSREKHKSLIQEIKMILKYTNVTPFKSRNFKYDCAYCRTHIDDPDDLRSHTRTVHAGKRFSGVDVFMKSRSINEILRLDIVDLRCIVCPAPIDSWNNMFVHLKEIHNVELVEAYTKVIPYKLMEPMTCALCEDRCNLYTLLDAHMNTHYYNYICDDCGDTFISETRFKKHLETHSTVKFKCPKCPKFFALEKYRKKHVEVVHKHGRIFRCCYCNEEFVNEFRRHQHMEMNHKEKIKTITCQICEKTFTFRPYYLKHLRFKHTKEDKKKHKCSMCDKKFLSKYDWRKHEEWHLGYNKQKCLLCDRTFASKPSLESHYEKMHSDSKVFVLETGQTLS